MNSFRRELEGLADQIYREYNEGNAKEILPPDINSVVFEMARGSDQADSFAVYRLAQLRPKLDVRTMSYRVETPGASDTDCPKRGVAMIFEGEERWIVDPFIVDVVDGIEQTVYGPNEDYSVSVRGDRRIVPLLFRKELREG